MSMYTGYRRDMDLTSDKIKKYRSQLGLTQQQVAGLLGVARTTYLNIEKGDRQIRPEEHAKLLEVFASVIVEPSEAEVVEIDTLMERFKVLDPSMEEVLPDFQEILRQYYQIPESRNKRELPKYDSYIPEAIASEERKRFGLGVSPAKYLRNILEVDMSIPVVCLPFLREYSCCFSGQGILSNKAVSQEEQVYGLAIGYYYLLSGVPESAIYSGCKKNSFADEFLMPREPVIASISRWRPVCPEISLPEVRMHSCFYGVTPWVFLRRLKDLGIEVNIEVSPDEFHNHNQEEKLPLLMRHQVLEALDLRSE
jgi:DNA-binding XRE family transcriptional regulator